MNAEQFKNIFLPVSQKLFRLAYRYLEDSQDAEDIVQETFVKLWLMREKLSEIINPEAFATTITRNLCLDKLKSKKTTRIDQPSSMNIQNNDYESPYQLMEDQNNHNIIKYLINTLPEQQKTIMVMRDLEEYSFEEIEEQTGFNLNYIRVNLSRARKLVRDEFIKFHEYGNQRNKNIVGEI